MGETFALLAPAPALFAYAVFALFFSVMGLSGNVVDVVQKASAGPQEAVGEFQVLLWMLEVAFYAVPTVGSLAILVASGVALGGSRRALMAAGVLAILPGVSLWCMYPLSLALGVWAIAIALVPEDDVELEDWDAS